MVQAEGWPYQGSKAEAAWDISHRGRITGQRALEGPESQGWGYLLISNPRKLFLEASS